MQQCHMRDITVRLELNESRGQAPPIDLWEHSGILDLVIFFSAEASVFHRMDQTSN